MHLIGGRTDADGVREVGVQPRHPQEPILDASGQVPNPIVVLPGSHVVAVQHVWFEGANPPPRAGDAACKEKQSSAHCGMRLAVAKCTAQNVTNKGAQHSRGPLVTCFGHSHRGEGK